MKIENIIGEEMGQMQMDPRQQEMAETDRILQRMKQIIAKYDQMAAQSQAIDKSGMYGDDDGQTAEELRAEIEQIIQAQQVGQEPEQVTRPEARPYGR